MAPAHRPVSPVKQSKDVGFTFKEIYSTHSTISWNILQVRQSVYRFIQLVAVVELYFNHWRWPDQLETEMIFSRMLIV